MTDTLTLARLTLREAFRRPLPYVAAAAVALLAVASRFFLGFSFGEAGREAVNIAISSVFLAGFLLAAFLGTALVRHDLERGTLGLLLTKPLGLASYLAGRFAGLALTTIVVALLVGGAVTALFALLATGGRAELIEQALHGCARAILPVLVLDAAAIAISAIAPRVLGPLALVALFLAGSLAGSGFVGLLLPDFGVFGLEAGFAPSWGVLMLYTLSFSLIFLLIGYIVLGERAAARRS